MVTSGLALFGPTSTFIAVERAARDAGLFVSVATGIFGVATDQILIDGA